MLRREDVLKEALDLYKEGNVAELTIIHNGASGELQVEIRRDPFHMNEDEFEKIGQHISATYPPPEVEVDLGTQVHTSTCTRGAFHFGSCG